MEKQSRLVGIDLFRGFAAFAVVILHSDEGVKVQSPVWKFMLNVSDFAVPFFLATSFFLVIRSLHEYHRPYRWQTRIRKLLVPFYSWGIVYLSWESLRLWLNHKPQQLQLILEKFPSLFILGKADFAFHLYFIPLLIAGTVILAAIAPIIRSNHWWLAWLIALIISLFAYQLFEDYKIIQASSQENFNGILQFGLVILGYIIRCLPYIFISQLLLIFSLQNQLRQIKKFGLISLTILFIFFNIFEFVFLPSTVVELLQAYSALMLALALSISLRETKTLNSLSKCSFGIYLMHLLILFGCWTIVQRVGLQSQLTAVPFVIAIAVVAFVVSWIITSLLMRQKLLAKVLFGQ